MPLKSDNDWYARIFDATIPVCQFYPLGADAIDYALKRAKQRAVKKQISYRIERERLLNRVRNFTCEVSGLPFIHIDGERWYRQPFVPSIDRIDSRFGYSNDNVLVVCAAINYLKSDWDYAVVKTIAFNICLNNEWIRQIERERPTTAAAFFTFMETKA